MHAAQVFERQVGSRSPCPNAAQGGSTGPFQFICGSDLQGSDYMQLSASSLLACTALCTNYGAACVAVAYEASSQHSQKNCYLKKSVPKPVKQTYIMDSAIVLHDIGPSDCGSLQKRISVNGMWFETSCDMDYPGNDLQDGSYHTTSLLECANICAGKRGCKGVSFEAAMTHGNGYFNCYLKSSGDAGKLFQQQFNVDSAIVVAGDFPSPVAPQPSPVAPQPSARLSTISVGPTSQAGVQTLVVTMTSLVTAGQPTSSHTGELSSLMGPTPAVSTPTSTPRQPSSSNRLVHRTCSVGLVISLLLHVAHFTYMWA